MTLQDDLDELERTNPAVRKASKALDAVYRNVGGGLSREEIKAIYDPPVQCTECPPTPAVERIEWVTRETPAEGVLDDDERRGY